MKLFKYCCPNCGEEFFAKGGRPLLHCPVCKESCKVNFDIGYNDFEIAPAIPFLDEEIKKEKKKLETEQEDNKKKEYINFFIDLLTISSKKEAFEELKKEEKLELNLQGGELIINGKYNGIESLRNKLKWSTEDIVYSKIDKLVKFINTL